MKRAWRLLVLDSKAVTKIQAAILIVIIIVASVSGIAAYFLLSTSQSAETIKIGLLVDLPSGQEMVNGAILAAEEINAEGGLLGKQIEIVWEDSDIAEENVDPSKAITALTRLITYDKVDFVISGGGENYIIDTAVEHKKILFGTVSPSVSLTQRVAENYDRYKYFFRLSPNETTFAAQFADSLVHLREITGFNKVAYLAFDMPQIKVSIEALNALPEDYGFDLVYRGLYPWGTLDFSSYFAAGAEIMMPLVITPEGVAIVKEWYERQSPMVLWGLISAASDVNSWNDTEGKVEHITVFAPSALQLGYPATNKTLTTQEAYLNRWGTQPELGAVATYDCIRFLLYDALQRAQTTETEAVIKALEQSEVSNSLEENFKFTANHDHYFESFNETAANMMFQWQEDGVMAIVYPKAIMEETGATYTYPEWQGPWSK
jgi:branched-chain amino acid transport system substrate-binding protein